MTAEKRLRDTRYVFRWHVVTYQTENSLYSLSAFCTRSAVCILYWPIGVACDNTDSILSPGAISYFVFLSTILEFEAQPVETKNYNRNTSLHFPKLFPFLFFRPPCWNLRRVTAVHSFPDPRSRFPIPRSLLPVLVTSPRTLTHLNKTCERLPNVNVHQ